MSSDAGGTVTGRRRRSRPRVAAGVVIACLVVLWSPYVFIFAFLLVYSLVRAARSRQDRRRLAWVVGAGIFGALVAAEVYCFVFDARVFWAPLFSYDPDLGFGKVVDDLEDFGGYRRTPTSDPESPCEVAIFGGSFAHGGGLEESETVATYLAAAARHPVAVHNFGLGGYGAHQMLRMLEVRRVERVVGKEFEHAIYIAIPHHVQRATGKMPWDLSAPMYEPKPDGGARYVGPSFSRPVAWLLYQLQRSYTGSFVLQRTLLSPILEPGDYARYIAIVRETQRLVERAFGATFRIVAWRDPSGDIVPLLREEGFPVYDVEEIIPEMVEDPDAFRLPDGHPDARANARVGEFLARTLERENGGRICREPE